MHLLANLNEQRADDLELVELKLRANRDARLGVAADIMSKSETGALGAEEFRLFKSAVDDASKYHQQHEMLKELRRTSLKAVTLVRSEPRTYGPAHPERSFFRDLMALGDPVHPDRAGAVERMARHGKEAGIEARSASPEGRRASRAWLEAYRSDDLNSSRRNAFDEELRAMSSGSTSGGSFVTPTYLVDLFATWRSPYRAFADQCRPVPLPPYGLQVNVPSFTSTTSVGEQTENSGVDIADPSGTYLTAAVVPLVGAVFASQQLYDRGGQDGLSFDTILGLQLKEQLDQQVDSYVLSQALASPGSVTDSSSFSISALYADLSKAREQMQDTAGTRLKGTHAFFTSDLWGHITSQVDDSHRPIILPAFTAEPWASLVAAGDPKGEGWAGHVLPSGLAVFEDNSIPASGSDTQIIVARPHEVLMLEGDPIPIAYPETGAATLSVIVGLRAYVATIVRYPKAIQTISGSAYGSTLS
jgi:hypothetical protein